MSPHNPVRHDLGRRLQDAIDEMRRQLVKVEIWAGAVEGFSKPVPSYQPDRKYLLPQEPPKTR